MCARVWYPYSEIEIDTVGELRKLVNHIVFLAERQFSDDCCLCVVDFPATARANGCEFIADDIGDYTLNFRGNDPCQA